MNKAKEKKQKVCLVVVGCGYWGKKIIRTLIESFHNINIICVELSDTIISESKKIFPKIIFYKNIKEVDPMKVNGFILATPTNTHYKLASVVLKMGKPVWIEKTATCSQKNLLKIKNVSKKFNIPVFVDFTYLYDDGIRHLKDSIEKILKNEIYQIRSIRTNYGIFRNDDSVVEDLAVHDLTILRYLFNSEPIGVFASGSSLIKGKINDTSQIHLLFSQNRHAYITVSWQSPVKTRTLEIIGCSGMLIYKENDRNRQLDYYKKNHSKFVLQKTDIIKIKKEPLQKALEEYIKSYVIKGESLKECLIEAEKNQKILDAINLSITNFGKYITI